MQSLFHLEQHRKHFDNEPLKKKMSILLLGLAGFACVTLLIILGQGM